MATAVLNRVKKSEAMEATAEDDADEAVGRRERLPVVSLGFGLVLGLFFFFFVCVFWGLVFGCKDGLAFFVDW